MSDWLPIIYKLVKITELPGSDYLEFTTVMDEYPCVIRKGQYKEGQLVSWIPYDSVVPSTDMFYFLASKDKNYPIDQVPIRYRIIKSKRIRGFYSEGLIVDAPLDFKEGDSIVDHFGLTKRVYEEEFPDTPDNGSNDNEYNPKTFNLSKYDLDGMAKYSYVFQEGEQVLITEKMEGENCAMVFTEDNLWVKSRNHFKREAEDSKWWDIPNRLNMKDKLSTVPGLVVFGELVGGVRGWFYDCPIIDNKVQRKFFVFDIFDLKLKRFLEWNKVKDVCYNLQLETVPILYEGLWKTDRSLHDLAEGKSTLGTCVKEGWVMRSVPESWHEKLGRKIIKLKGRDYKLKKG